jgi:cytochrome P450
MLWKTALDHVSWLFFPGRFLFSGSHPRLHRVVGWETVRFVDSQDEVQAVNQATGDVFLGGAGNGFLGALLGPQSVFLLDHERHRLARRITGSALTRCTTADYTRAVDRYVDQALDRTSSVWPTPLGRWSRALTMRAMCKMVLDIDDEASARQFFRRFELTTGFTANLVSYSKSAWQPRGMLSIGSVAAGIVGRLDRLVYATIADRKRSGAPGESPLDALIRAQAEHGYDDAFIRDNLVALIAAGYETTAAAIAWMLYWLSQTGAYRRLRARRAAGDQEYLTAFRNECLRYCPPVEILPRKVAPDRREAAVDVLPDLATPGANGELPMVCPCVHRVHHDESVHADPHRFDPERFLGRSYGPTEYLPFGLGRRFCLGAAVGQRLMDRVLERLLARGLEFELRRGSLSPVRRNVIIWPGAFLLARLHRHDELPICPRH